METRGCLTGASKARQFIRVVVRGVVLAPQPTASRDHSGSSALLWTQLECTVVPN